MFGFRKSSQSPHPSSWHEWRDQAWASSRVKKQETPDISFPRSSQLDHSDRDDFHNSVTEQQQMRRQNLEKKIHERSITKAVGRTEWMQETINTMAKNIGINSPPQLLIHHNKLTIFSEPTADGSPSGMDVQVVLPEYIEMSAESISHFTNHRDQFQAVIAHELAHILNDHRANNENVQNRYGQTPEILADKMGAIIHGNPKAYATALHAYLHKHQPMHSRYSERYPSVNQRARTLHKWAEMLENECATDKKTGTIIDQSKAMTLFSISKDMTTILQNSILNQTQRSR